MWGVKNAEELGELRCLHACLRVGECHCLDRKEGRRWFGMDSSPFRGGVKLRFGLETVGELQLFLYSVRVSGWA